MVKKRESLEELTEKLHCSKAMTLYTRGQFALRMGAKIQKAWLLADESDVACVDQRLRDSQRISIHDIIFEISYIYGNNRCKNGNPT